jgi:hypothetical protein
MSRTCRSENPSAERTTDGRSGRDAAGRFTKGNPGGPGNPFARRTAAMRKALCEAVSEEDLRQIAEALKQKAKEGDVAAARLVLSYVVGRPEATVNPDTLEQEEMRQYLREPELAARMPGVLQTIDAETCCDIVRAARPGIVEGMRQQMAEAMFTGCLPGTGEQVAPPLDPDEWMRQDVTEEESAPSGNGDNGGAGVRVAQPAAVRRRGAARTAGAKRKAGHGSQRGETATGNAHTPRNGARSGRKVPVAGGDIRRPKGGRHRQETGETVMNGAGKGRRGGGGRQSVGQRRAGLVQ